MLNHSGSVPQVPTILKTSFLILAVCFFSILPVSATTITDNFESYPIGSFNNTGQSNWSIQKGTWEITSGTTNRIHPSTTSESRLKLQNFTGRNFNMSVDMMCNSSSGYNGLLVRWDGSSAAGFLLDTSVQHNVMRLWAPVSPGSYTLLNQSSCTFNQFQEYNIRVISNDSKLTFYVDNIEVLNYKDFFRQDTIMSEGGYVGLYGKSNVFFDNFSIETLIENNEYLNYFDYTNADNNSVTLKWSLSGYNNATIRRGTDIDIINTEIYHGAATTYIDNGLSVDANYYYSITYDNSTDGHIVKAFTYNIPTTKKYVAFGDSITLGLGLPANESYPYRLNKTIATNAYANITHSISAISGYTTNGVIFGQLDDILTEKPTFTTLMIGFNDFNIDGSDENNYHANFNYIINESTKHGIDCFILKIINTSNSNVQPYVGDTNIWIDSLGQEYVVDTYDAVDLTPFDEIIQGYNASFFYDGAHLNSIGTKNINKSIYDYMISVDYFEDYLNSPQNIQTTPSQTWINITWDAVPNADKYSVYELQNGFPYVDIDPVVNGIKDAIYDYAHEFLIFSPNPVNPGDYGTIYPVRTSLGAYLLIECVDNDDKLGDDDTIYYFDLDNDGLTVDDPAWKITNNGIKKYLWGGGSWQVTGVSDAVGASTGGGTHYPIHELFIPIAELGANWTNGSTVNVLVKREDSSLSPDVVTWYPYGNINDTDTSLWQEMVLNDPESYILLDNTTYLWYNATGLTPFTIYHGAVSAWDGSVESNYTLFDVITVDIPTYTVSGTVSDTDGYPIAGTTVYSCNGFIHEITTTNVSGYWIGYKFREDNYTICASKAGYYDNSIDVFVDGNLTNQNITLTAVPFSKYQKIGVMFFAIPTILSLVFQKIADVIPIIVVLVFIMLIINVIGVAIHAIRVWR